MSELTILYFSNNTVAIGMWAEKQFVDFVNKIEEEGDCYVVKTRLTNNEELATFRKTK
jgi:hypothetical protein